MSFNIDIEQFIQKTGHDATKVFQMSVERAMRTLIKFSPVDTGNFRSNWRLGVNTPDLTPTPPETILRRDRLRGLGHGRNIPPVPPTEAVQSLFNNVSKLRFGDSAYITNETMYGPDLNQYHTPMISLAVSDLTSFLV